LNDLKQTDIVISMKIAKKTKPLSYLKINLIGKRLILRPYKFSDFKKCKASHVARLPSSNKFDKPIGAGKELNYEKFKVRVQRFRVLGVNRHHFIFGVFDKHSEVYIGQIDLLMINQEIRWGNLGYHIQNQYYGKGYATEASILALKVAFKLLDFHRIEAAMELDNLASEKVAKNIGLEFEGKRKKFFPNDGGIDMNVYATNAIDY
jgi:RimJ/RimL family protein N-acetyltransferase